MPMPLKNLPSLEVLRGALEVDESSPTGLRWRKNGKPAGNVGTSGYARLTIAGKAFAAHRIVWSLANGRLLDTETFIDHINGVRNDNRVANLRTCTNAENLQNVRDTKGVCFQKAKQKWRGLIFVNRKRIYLGDFPTEEQAREAYRKAKVELHPFSRQAMEAA